VKRLRLGIAVAVAIAMGGVVGHARAEQEGRATVDRVAVRYYAPETGGPARPRYITERMLAFEARLEAMSEGNPSAAAAQQDRYARAAIDRHIAEDLLEGLMIERGQEPLDLPAMVSRARTALMDRVGGVVAFGQAMGQEGIDDSELLTMLRRQIRAAYYVDRTITPILHPREEELREAFHTSLHPFANARFEDVHDQLERWFIVERLRVAEMAFLQAARTRVKIVLVPR
jgi:hypothetical protein